jgi:hypothetical protein
MVHVLELEEKAPTNVLTSKKMLARFDTEIDTMGR